MSEYTLNSTEARETSRTRNFAETAPAITSTAVTIVGGQPMASSYEIAQAFDRRHDDVLRAIRFLKCSPAFRSRNFELAEQERKVGAVTRKLPFYRITFDGFVFLVGRLGGEKAAAVTEAYIERFNWMRDQLATKAASPIKSPVPTPAPFTAPTFLSLRYEGHPLRITRMAGGYWYGSSGLARALGWIDSGSITRHLCGADQVRVVPNKGRSLMVIDHATMMVMVERAKPHLAQRFLRWLGSALRSNYGEQAPALPAPLDPLERVTGDARQLGLDWYAECRQAVHAAGGRMPALDAAAVKRAADGMAAQLVADRRWELRFDRAGLPHLKGFPDKTLVLDLDDVGALAQLVHRQTDAAALQALLDAGLKRLTALASPLP